MNGSAPRARLVAILSVVTLGTVVACSSSPSSPAPSVAHNPVTGPGLGNTGSGGPPPTGATVKIVGVGDTGLCGSQGVSAVARLVGTLDGPILLVGDLAYPDGSAANYRDCFEPHWGRMRSRFRAVPGNHDYQTSGARGYLGYFAEAAGDDGTGFYSFMAGDWLVLMLNSNVPAGRNSIQWEFVRRQLDQQRTPCTMAVWHHPLFSSGPNGDNVFMQDMWALLEAAPIEVILTGHDHLYERFARQMSDGTPEPAKGVRQFTVGTGGADLYGIARSAPNSEVRLVEFGALQFTLEPAQYRWEFRKTDGTVVDFGLETCR